VASKDVVYLTTLILARFLTKDGPKLKENETNMLVINAVDTWKHSDFFMQTSKEENQAPFRHM